MDVNEILQMVWQIVLNTPELQYILIALGVLFVVWLLARMALYHIITWITLKLLKYAVLLFVNAAIGGGYADEFLLMIPLPLPISLTRGLVLTAVNLLIGVLWKTRRPLEVTVSET